MTAAEGPSPATGDRVRLHVVIVTGDRSVYDGEAERVSVPGTTGMLTILPHHAALMAIIEEGELVVRRGNEQESFAVGGGLVEVWDNEVTVLGDSVERAEDIDIERAEAARLRAQQMLRIMRERPEAAATIHALRRSRARLRVAQRARRSSRPR